MAQTRINNDNIQETTIEPGKLSTGAPVWNSLGDVTAVGTVSATSFFGDGSTLSNVVKSNQTNVGIISAAGFQGPADYLTGNFKGDISQSTGISNTLQTYISANTVNKLVSDIKYGDLTVIGQISASGGVNIVQSTTTGVSTLSVFNPNIFSGPALYVRQSGQQDIATFIDSEGGTVLHINNISPFDATEPGGVGILTEKPNETLTVRGTISASSAIYSGASGIRIGNPATTISNISGIPIQLAFDRSYTRETGVPKISLWNDGSGLYGIGIGTPGVTVGDGSLEIFTYENTSGYKGDVVIGTGRIDAGTYRFREIGRFVGANNSLSLSGDFYSRNNVIKPLTEGPGIEIDNNVNPNFTQLSVKQSYVRNLIQEESFYSPFW